MSENKVMEAGRELDLAVAVRVMGAHIKGGSVYMNGARYAEDPRWNDGSPRWLPHYSTSIADAWEVLEHVHSTERQVESLIRFKPDNLGGSHERYFYCRIGTGTAEALTAPLAICRAALAALESKG